MASNATASVGGPEKRKSEGKAFLLITAEQQRPEPGCLCKLRRMAESWIIRIEALCSLSTQPDHSHRDRERPLRRNGDTRLNGSHERGAERPSFAGSPPWTSRAWAVANSFGYITQCQLGPKFLIGRRCERLARSRIRPCPTTLGRQN